MNFSLINKNVAGFSAIVLSIGLLLAAVWVLGKVINQMLQPPLEIVQPLLQKQDSISSTANLTPAKPSYLFGRPQAQPIVAKPEPVAENLEEIQDTKLNIKLTGILYTPEDSVAVIEENNKTFVLRTGEELRSDIVIEQIEPNFVVLNNRGKLEKLALQESELPVATRSAKTSIPEVNQADKEKLEKIRNDVRKTPLAMNRYVRFRNLMRDGKMYAIQVWPRRERALFESLGFKNGDKILAVDGVAISEMQQNPQQLQQLMQKTQFSLQIERSGQIQNLSVSL